MLYGLGYTLLHASSFFERIDDRGDEKKMKERSSRMDFFVVYPSHSTPPCCNVLYTILVPPPLETVETLFYFFEGIGLTSHAEIGKITLVSSVLHIRYDNKMPG